jgi:general secretion pathway protein G
MHTMKLKKRRNHGAGFTLVELVIVLTIIGILVGSGAWMMMGWIDEARYEKARMAIRDIDLAIKGFERGNYSRPPTQDQGLQALVVRPTSEPAPQRWRQYISAEQLLDPWGNEYQYKTPGEKSGQKYDLWSLGENAEDETDDIGNWSGAPPKSNG